MNGYTSSGIDVLGEVPWGTHFSQFYETHDDLLEILIPYFKAGLENNEYCLWIVSNPEHTVEEATGALEKAVPDLDRQLADGNIEILTASDWYLENNVFSPPKVIAARSEKYNRALGRGLAGMRSAGDTLWFGARNSDELRSYERQLDNTVYGRRMLILCTYTLESSGAAGILDAVNNHRFALVKRKGKWEMIETAVQMKAHAEIVRLTEAKAGERISRLHPILNYLIAVLAVAVAVFALSLIRVNLSDRAPYSSLLLCAVIFSTWLGGVRAGWLAVFLSSASFAYYFLDPPFGLLQIMRLSFFLTPASFFVWLIASQTRLSGSLKRALNVLEQTVRRLKQTNSKLSEEVAERKQAEEALRESELRIRLTVDTIPIMIWTLRPDGVIDYVNRRWTDYAGQSLEEIKDPSLIVHPEDLPRAREKWLANKPTKQPTEDEMRLLRADGVYRWFLIRTAPLCSEHGDLLKWFGVCVDIEDTKELSAALKHSERRYLSLFENMAEGVAYFRGIFDDGKLTDAVYLEVNRSWEKLAGLQNVVGRKLSEVLPGALETGSEMIERSSRVALTGQSDRFETYSAALKKWISVSAYCPLKEHVIVVLDDISERKLAEENLKDANSRLQQLTSHLQNVRETERTSIAREIHDELGQQLTGLKIDVLWVEKRIATEEKAIREKISDMVTLIDETVKSVRRISTELRPSILDDFGLIAALEWQAQEFQKRTGIESIFVANSSDLNFDADLSTNIFRVYQEALTNITRHAAATLVETIFEHNGHHATLTIKDNGQGFDLNQVQINNSLGLIGMKERAMLFHGELSIDSSKTTGTQITLKIPLIPPDNGQS